MARSVYGKSRTPVSERTGDRRRDRIAGLLAAAAVAGLLAGGPAAPGPASQAQAASMAPAPLARGWARVVMAGTLASVAAAGGTVSLAIGGPSTADVFEGGTMWRTHALSGTHVVHLLAQTVVADTTSRPLAADLLRTGDHATVWGVMRPDGEIMALSMMVSTPRPAAQSSSGPSPGVAGVVAARSGSTLDVVTDTGTRHAVLLTATTQVHVDSGTAAASAIAPFDVVRIDGPVNSDGSLVAARVTVEFMASQGAQVSGAIESVHGEVGGLVVGGTMVCTSAQTYLVRGASRLWLPQMAAGRPVTAYGWPIVAGGTPVGLAARVIAVH